MPKSPVLVRHARSRLAVGCVTFGLAIAGAIAAPGGQNDTAMAALSRRFAREIWPLLTRRQSGCIRCHGERHPSQLHLSGDPDGSFHRLLVDGLLDPDNPSSLLARVDPRPGVKRMPPPPAPAWNAAEVARLRAFVDAVSGVTAGVVEGADERFPAALLNAFHGRKRQTRPDTTFLSYRQLRGKVITLFGDRWERNERDLFAENVQQFGGADFRRRFDESTRPAATFLAAVDQMGRDVASRALLLRTGPFQHVSIPNRGLTAPQTVPDAAHRRAIGQLYRRLLFREPDAAEVREAFRLLQGIARREQALDEEPSDLTFELEIEGASGLKTVHGFTLPVGRERLGLYQEFLNQDVTSEDPFVRRALAGPIDLKSRAVGQELRLTNAETHGNVSLHAIILKGPLPDQTTTVIPVTAPGVRLEGAWRTRRDGDETSYEDRNENKGDSRIVVPLSVLRDGCYEVSVSWRKGLAGRNAERVLVEVLHQGPSHPALPDETPLPPRGEAHFWIDQSVDNVAFRDLQTAFRFASPEEGVEIRNEGTRARVVADAVKFVPVASGTTLLLDEDEADGQENWEPFTRFSFRPYNITGKSLISDGSRKKGELKLLYRPGRRAGAWNPKGFYRVEVGFPGQADNETRAPVIVRASESAPIVRLRRPRRARLGDEVTMDAGSSFDLQRGPLRFTWRQIGGPRVAISDPHAPRVTFRTTKKSGLQAAWEGLCRALVKHPDFLFSRPPSLDRAVSPGERRRLQLLRIAQDLVARAPTDAEVRKLESGIEGKQPLPLETLINDYLRSAEFRSFYFHRVRLYLESRGTEEEDEPARLWCYVAFNNRPFREILTAEYSVDPAFLKRSRPAYHGRTGILTMKGFIRGKPGLPHFNYPAQVAAKFLGYVFEVPPEIVETREGITAAATTDPNSLCYSCHKILTPLAYQRTAWTDDGEFRPTEDGRPVDDTDRGVVSAYPFRGKGMEAFAAQAVRKERFLRTMIQTHFIFYFGREMRYDRDERDLYRRLWDTAQTSDLSIKAIIRALMTSPEYLDGRPTTNDERPTTLEARRP